MEDTSELVSVARLLAARGTEPLTSGPHPSDNLLEAIFTNHILQLLARVDDEAVEDMVALSEEEEKDTMALSEAEEKDTMALSEEKDTVALSEVDEAETLALLQRGEERLLAPGPLSAIDITAAAAKLRDFTTEAAVASGKAVLICVTALLLGVLPGRSRGHFWPPYRNQVFGPEISTYFTDPYTFLHFEDGILAYLLWGWWGSSTGLQPTFPLEPQFARYWDNFGGLALGLALGYIFEIFENSDYVITQLTRDHGTSQFYRGDSKLNVFGDILALGIGYAMTKVCFTYGLGWFPLLWLLLSELLCALTFRDNLVLAAVQTVAPQAWIKEYQEAIVPKHLRGIMRAGYWENKVRDTPQQFMDKIQRINPQLTKFSRYSGPEEALGVSRRYWRDTMARL